MKSTSHGMSIAHQVGHEEDRALEDADEQEVAATVVVRDLGAELGDPPVQRLSSMRTSSTAAVSSFFTWFTLLRRPRPPHRAPGDSGDTRPRRPCTTSGQASRSDRGILASTKILHLLAAVRREPVSGPPAAHVEAVAARKRLQGPHGRGPSAGRGLARARRSRTPVPPPGRRPGRHASIRPGRRATLQALSRSA